MNKYPTPEQIEMLFHAEFERKFEPAFERLHDSIWWPIFDQYITETKHIAFDKYMFKENSQLNQLLKDKAEGYIMSDSGKSTPFKSVFNAYKKAKKEIQQQYKKAIK